MAFPLQRLLRALQGHPRPMPASTRERGPGSSHSPAEAGGEWGAASYIGPSDFAVDLGCAVFPPFKGRARVGMGARAANEHWLTYSACRSLNALPLFSRYLT